MDYVRGLETVLRNYVPKAHSLNILGGEPLISPHLAGTLNLIRKLKTEITFPKIVLTTNGSALLTQFSWHNGFNFLDCRNHAVGYGATFLRLLRPPATGTRHAVNNDV